MGFADVNETLHEEEYDEAGVSMQRGPDYEDFHTMLQQTNFPMDTNMNPEVYKKAIEYLRNVRPARVTRGSLPSRNTPSSASALPFISSRT